MPDAANGTTISAVDADEILDSRGWPTVSVRVRLVDGSIGSASVPAGASTGRHEAAERRDGNPSRFGGRGVQDAVAAITGEIDGAVRGMDAAEQGTIDRALTVVDGTANKGRLGANAILAVSLAVARAAASSRRVPLYKQIRGGGAHRLPVPLMNVINGGRHADNGLPFQEFMIVPHGATNFAEALRWGAEVYHALADTLRKRGHRTAVGDEGGFAPDLGERARGLRPDRGGDYRRGLHARAAGRHRPRPGSQFVPRR